MVLLHKCLEEILRKNLLSTCLRERSRNYRSKRNVRSSCNDKIRRNPETTTPSSSIKLRITALFIKSQEREQFLQGLQQTCTRRAVCSALKLEMSSLDNMARFLSLCTRAINLFSPVPQSKHSEKLSLRTSLNTLVFFKFMTICTLKVRNVNAKSVYLE